MKILKTSITMLLIILLLLSSVLAAYAVETDGSEEPPAPDVSDQPDTTDTTTPSEDPAEQPPQTEEPAEQPPQDTTPTEEPAEQAPQEPETPEPETPEPEPAPPPVIYRVDYSALTLQVAIANGLNEGDFTKDSWAQMTEKLENAKAALKSGGQYKVDNATKELKNAIAELVRMDYTALQKALNDLEAFREEYDTLYDLWFNMAGIVPEAQTLMGCGDQAAVDTAAAQIEGLLVQMAQQIEELGNPQIVIQEVEVEVPPKTDFCNISNHRLWPVLFFISLGVNVVMVVVIGLLARKKKNRTDNTPLIDYDIDDDLYSE